MELGEAVKLSGEVVAPACTVQKLTKSEIVEVSRNAKTATTMIIIKAKIAKIRAMVAVQLVSTTGGDWVVITVEPSVF